MKKKKKVCWATTAKGTLHFDGKGFFYYFISYFLFSTELFNKQFSAHLNGFSLFSCWRSTLSVVLGHYGSCHFGYLRSLPEILAAGEMNWQVLSKMKNVSQHIWRVQLSCQLCQNSSVTCARCEANSWNYQNALFLSPKVYHVATKIDCVWNMKWTLRKL